MRWKVGTRIVVADEELTELFGKSGVVVTSVEEICALVVPQGIRVCVNIEGDKWWILEECISPIYNTKIR